MPATTSDRSRRGPRIERASPADQAFLAMDTGKLREQFGVLLILDRAPGISLEAIRTMLARRITAVPRLRQVVVTVPFGCGGPIWVDDPQFDISNHVRSERCPEPCNRRALLDAALSVVATPLNTRAPLWAAVLVTGLDDGRAALVLVLHHVLADGIGGLTVLTNLVDGRPSAADAGFPRPSPTAAALARQALAVKLRALVRGKQSWRLLRSGTGAGGGLHPPRAVACSLIQKTGSQRCLAVVNVNIAAMRAAAHPHGATVNDAVLVAVAGALARVLASNNESLDTVVITVPVSGRSPAEQDDLGNMVSPLLVPVAAAGGAGERMERVAARVREGRAAATGPAPIAVLGWLFRPLARLGAYRWYMDHQHRFHTLVSSVRGPAEQVSVGGCLVTEAIPIGVAEGGNVTVYFEVLSYAGTLAITAIVDPEHFPSLDCLINGLRAELDLIIASAPAKAAAS
ncbi:MAG TPA: wax ester/triacylglycerol synthase domain-containing protein [Streptosporangiaceae bacterium]|nr:wax ester/triacylglycerol synthase domain-containing protein [Streptosporangiaceae bacterium]